MSIRTFRNCFLIAIALAPLAASAAQQRITIDVGSPDFHPLPIAIAKFKAEGEATAAAVDMEQVLKEDLTLSGIFEVLDPKSFLADASEGFAEPTIKFARWADVGADGLIKAAIRKVGPDLIGDLHLYEVRAGKEVLAQTLKGKPGSGRELAHRFADAIIRYYTHEPGIFGTRIAAVRKSRSGSDLMLFDVDGKGGEVLYHDSITLLPSWKPDGSGLLVTSFRSGRAALWSIGLANRAPHQVASKGDMTTGGAYSPDGRQIAFTVSSEGNADIWVANADGSSAHRITQDPATDASPSWSPDGKRIAFVSTRAGTPQIYVMNADGSGQKRLTFQGSYNQTPRWSPRGDLIAFTARDERKVFDIFTVSPDTGKIQRVTQDQGNTNEEPSWAPNGRLLAFTSDRNGRPQLVISTPNGDRQNVVTSDAAELATPAWGPLPQ